MLFRSATKGNGLSSDEQHNLLSDIAKKTEEKLKVLRQIRGHVVMWPGQFAVDSHFEKEIKDSPAIRIIEMASRGFFL